MNTSNEAIRQLEDALMNARQSVKTIDDLIVVHEYQDVASLIAVLRQMAVVASDQTHRVRVAFSEGGARFSVETPDLCVGHRQLDRCAQTRMHRRS